ncbi:hypothetical protein CSA56_16490 [candidate division KSB3 bacterium]|uniref:Uncharacterized protein n=1 Tax=candidate division KSB3 bacterium TaxID=2044937 RepID=A0A2G6K8U0_9BACT|nr:MAG: hypothetical protein CSA56_16490 [candidate division KSB3 bacterium]
MWRYALKYRYILVETHQNTIIHGNVEPQHFDIARADRESRKKALTKYDSFNTYLILFKDYGSQYKGFVFT